MYLFQPLSIRKVCGRTVIYIPLCIYFNLNFSCQNLRRHPFTFHYVSISTKLFPAFMRYLCYLHSTMYLFQLLYNFCASWILFIYIPLCIYFNLIDWSIGISHWLNLHSTMYLFQLWTISIFTKSQYIYIPLCIYFN